MKHHQIAWLTISLAAVLDCLAGIWYAAVMGYPQTSGLCYALGVATTSGSSVPAGTSPQARLVTAVIQVTIIPLFGATFSLFTSALANIHIKRVEKKIDC